LQAKLKKTDESDFKKIIELVYKHADAKKEVFIYFKKIRFLRDECSLIFNRNEKVIELDKLTKNKVKYLWEKTLEIDKENPDDLSILNEFVERFNNQLGKNKNLYDEYKNAFQKEVEVVKLINQ